MRVVVERRNRLLGIRKTLNQNTFDIQADTGLLQKEARQAQDLEDAKKYYGASRLQGIVRGFLVRILCKELRRELKALLVIQRVIRGKLGRIKWMREYWRSISVVKSAEALDELIKRSKLVRRSSQWSEFFDPLTEAFWYYESRSRLSTWNVPLIFQKTLICNWEGFHDFGGAPSDKRCRRVFDNVAEYQGHVRTAHRWHCSSCFKQNSGLVFPLCSLCGNNRSERGRDGEKALHDSMADVHRKIGVFLSKENPKTTTNFKFKLRDRLVSLAVDKIALDTRISEEQAETRRLQTLEKSTLTNFAQPADVTASSGSSRKEVKKKSPGKKAPVVEDPWEVDNRRRRKNALRTTGCMIPALPLFSEDHGSPFNELTSSIAEKAADRFFKRELGGIEGERKLYADPVETQGAIPAAVFDRIISLESDASPSLQHKGIENTSTGDEGSSRTGPNVISSQSAFDTWDLQQAELGKDNGEHRLLVCDLFQLGQCSVSTCPRAHPGIRDKAEIFHLRLTGRSTKVPYVKCCPHYSGGGSHCGCADADACPLYHVYIRPSTQEIIRRIYPIQEGQKMKVLPSGAQIDGNLKDNRLSGYGIITWLNGASYAGEWRDDLRHGFGIFRTLQGTEYSGGWSEGKRNGMGQFINGLGEEYLGEWCEGKMEGAGTLTCSNGDSYVGQFKNHKFHGVGTYVKPSGSKFTGNCLDGVACGLGIMILNNGEKYKGFFDRNFRHGKGACSYPNGSYYVGQWYRGVPTGFGVYVAPNGEKYVGQFLGGRKEGPGRYTFLDGSFYDGEFHKDKAKGAGVYYASSGDVYSGEWNDDKRNGRGTYRYANASVYTGTWLDNNIHGKGKFDYASGSHYRGEFHKNEKHGRGIYTWPNGNVYKGQFQHERMCGKGEMNYIGGHRYTGEWYNSKKHGQGTFYYVTGAVYVGQWDGDVRRGKGRLTFLPGSFIEEYYEGDWEDDEMHGRGAYVYRKDEGTVYSGDWVRGRRHGTGKITYADGSYFSGSFCDEMMSGHGVYIGADGSQYTGEWLDNMREGKGTMLATDGSIYHGEYHHNMKHGHGRLQYPDGNVFEGEWRGNVIVGEDLTGRFTLICGKGSRGGPEEVTVKVFSY